ncbi:MAG TPA: hypothetical protein VHN36_02925, partial [Ilumatobacteraceae bacterium]|nr:hypothetical protein [Ilumatobacteraceae bacterium]
MTVVPSAIGLVASDLPRTLSFYRALGLEIPPGADNEPHVEVTLAGGFRILFDPESTIRSFDPEWTPASPGSPRTALAFECARAVGWATSGVRRRAGSPHRSRGSTHRRGTHRGGG